LVLIDVNYFCRLTTTILAGRHWVDDPSGALAGV